MSKGCPPNAIRDILVAPEGKQGPDAIRTMQLGMLCKYCSYDSYYR
jgi:hypothetical protein